MNIRYRVTLTAEERHELQALLSGSHGPVRQIKRAQILLAADAHSPDDLIARTVGVGTSTVYRTKQRFVEEGLAPALSELPRPGAPRKLGASDEALLVAVACSQPPVGRARWTLELLAGEMVRLTAHETLSGWSGCSRVGRSRVQCGYTTAWSRAGTAQPALSITIDRDRPWLRARGTALPRRGRHAG